MRQLQASASRGVMHLNVVQRHGRCETIRLDAYLANSHRCRNRARGQRFEPRAEFVDARHNHPVEDDRCEDQQRDGHAHEARYPAHHDGGGLDGELEQRRSEQTDEVDGTVASPPQSSEEIMTRADVGGSRESSESLLTQGQGATHASAATAGLEGAALHSRLVQRLRRRYADELALLPPGPPTAQSLRQGLDRLGAKPRSVPGVRRRLGPGLHPGLHPGPGLAW